MKAPRQRARRRPSTRRRDGASLSQAQKLAETERARAEEQAELSAQDAQREKRRAEQLQSRAVPHRRAIGHHDGVAAAVELGDFSLADA